MNTNKFIIIKAERQIIRRDKNIDNLCFRSKNLYNYVNFILRQVYFNKFDLILEYKDLIKSFKIKDKEYFEISEYKLTQRLAKLDQIDSRSLSPQCSQQIVKLLYKNWKSFYKSLRKYHNSKEEFNVVPKIPRYKHKIKGRNIVIFTNQEISLKGNKIHFPKKAAINPIETRISNINQVRIIPTPNCFVIEVVYEKEVCHVNTKPDTYLGIDLGVNNLATCANNIGLRPFIVNGRIAKSINQYFNKKKASLMSFIKDKGTSRKIKILSLKRDCKIEDYLHKSSKIIVDYCVKHEIFTIVIGKNDGWKQESNMGKKNNQNFVSIPFNSLIQKIQYKAEEVGINVIVTSEEYTSKCSFLDNEEIKKHNVYLGKRITRGLFRSANGTTINADVNSAFNIIKKEIPNAFEKCKSEGIEGIRSRMYPLIINPLRIDDHKRNQITDYVK
jgi:putative transposase